MQHNRLLKYEETREKQVQLQEDNRSRGEQIGYGRSPFTDYLLELDFDNIKNLWISKSKLREGRGHHHEQRRPSQGAGPRDGR